MPIKTKNTPTGSTVVKPAPAATASAELGAFLKAVEKQAPKVVTKANAILPIERIPTGCFEFDLWTGGGFPKGRISVIYGPESSGKSNTLYKAIANAQKLPPPCNVAVLVDVESTFDPVWAAKLGVDVSALLVVKPEYGEQSVDIVVAAVSVDAVAIIGYDSIAATVPSRELEGSVEKADVGTQAILIKRLINKITQLLSIEGRRGHFPAFVCTNQTRFKIGVMFGDPETMPGGNTFKFASSLTVRLYGKNEMVKEISSSLPVFKNTKMVIKKAKVGVLQYDGEYNMCTVAHDVLKEGDTASWNMVESHLKSSGRLVKGSKSWEYQGSEYRTLKDLSMRYYTDEPFRLSVQKTVILDNQGKAFTIELKDGSDVAPEDMEGKL
ncbi:MAG: hypothetical protein RR280_04240 [Bacteroidaceae bacterium]